MRVDFVKVKRGTLLMFPAWLHHSVDPNRSDRLRISVGFNIMFPAYAEVIARPLWAPDDVRPSDRPPSQLEQEFHRP